MSHEIARETSASSEELSALKPGQLHVIKRNGPVVDYTDEKISLAISKAFLAVEGSSAATSSRIHDRVQELTTQVSAVFKRRLPSGGTIHIEEIQDQVELALMRAGEHKVARSYVIYREGRSQERKQREAAESVAQPHPSLRVTKADGTLVALDMGRVQTLIREACEDLAEVDGTQIERETLKNLYDGVAEKDVSTALVMTARTLVEREPNYSQVTARLLMDSLRAEALSFLGLAESATYHDMAELYSRTLPLYIEAGIKHELLSPELRDFDLTALGAALDHTRDQQFTYLGLQTLYDRYFIHKDSVRFELPQIFFMRVAMGLSLNEPEKNQRAIEFYHLLSSFDYMASTPTLFNAGTLRPQLSSCYLTTVPDDLSGIYGAIHDNAMLSKFAGGLGNDWTPVRAMGSHIKGTNGKSQGVVPFLKVVNDTAVAVNQCFAPDTLIHTAKGPRAIRDLQTGDLVLGISGRYREVTHKMVYNQTEPMLSLEVKHSIEPIQVTAGHPFYALRSIPKGQTGERTLKQLAAGTRSPEWVEAGQLQVGDYMAQVIPTEVVPVAGLSEDDAHLYGILLGDGHLSKDGYEWGVSGNPQRDEHMGFVRDYLNARGIHFWETQRGETYGQIRWASGRGALRDATTGRITGAGASTLPFSYDDLYNAQGQKQIAARLSHLPRAQSLALIRGLLETDGNLSRGKEISFSNTSRALIEGLRYQLLRMGVPSAGNYRERPQNHSGTRSDGSRIEFKGTTRAYDLRIPAVAEIAEPLGAQVLRKRHWIQYNGCLFSRITHTQPAAITPFVFDLKVEGDESYMTTSGLAHNGGKRKGAVCAYLETWHMDIEEFLELRKNTGDDRRRTHDMNTANWIPDLFMKRVFDDGQWTLFSPSEVPDLHDLTGRAFEERYEYYEELTQYGKIKLFKTLPAKDLWRKMLSMLFETGHPWLTFKDPCNLRSPQQHVGVVHSSNLCTEITLNTSADEIAVCNLGSVNVVQHIKDGQLDMVKLERTVKTAVRMLDNVIEINYYSVPQARNSNLKHRPVGLGMMGFQDALYLLNTPYGSEEAVRFADQSMEALSYFAIQASCDLADERGTYSTFAGSLWSKGVLPLDSLDILTEARGHKYIEVDRSTTLDWAPVRARVQRGVRNSNIMAIAPTATISNIVGVSQSIEPTYQNLYVKSNLSGEFTVINPYLVHDLKARGLWDEVMVNDLKYYDGSLQKIERIPADLKALYATAFEVETRWIVEAASRRQKWIDQSQSLNLYIAGASGKKLDVTYRMAWYRGLKTTYYLRALAATSAEKSTITTGALNAVSSVIDESLAAPQPAPVPQACSIDNPDCEACQ